MARLLANGSWYEPVSSAVQYESDFEALVVSRACQLFPDYVLLPFKCTVESESDRAQADLALVEKSYRHWWVIEVETANHSLRSHVLPQIEVLLAGRYVADHVDYICSKSPSLSRLSVSEMIKGSQPNVLVLVNEPCPSWVEPIHNLGAQLAVLHMFRSDRNDYIIATCFPDTRSRGLWLALSVRLLATSHPQKILAFPVLLRQSKALGRVWPDKGHGAGHALTCNP